ncbi:tyrosine-type recombinase/integrase [Erwinia persicina]|uniref:Site-specific integrase n=1 Tax=Erwinia persicina TaxID=55211 RepID=A0ABR8ZY86_9GAMM|nr:site-specific integrase [Erwinia persicina]MBD8108680.1 site-specific integrase [Erwinia persicina]MBD8211789.1 site-specific integrase [Erwinia persicina]
MQYRIKNFVMEDGERNCVIIDRETDLPVYYENLFLTTNIRNRGKTVSTIEIVATKLVIFKEFCNKHKIDLSERIIAREFLNIFEVDNLIRFLNKRFDKKGKNHFKVAKLDSIAKRTFNYRVHVIAKYLEWLCEVIHSVNRIHAKNEVETFIKSIEAHKWTIRNLKLSDMPDRALDDKQVIELFKLVEIGSEMNPFSKDVQRRNRLIFKILINLGLRAGELLNLKIEDLDPYENTLYVRRRHDCNADPRTYQPLVKTEERVLQLSDELACEIQDYIIGDREVATKRKKHTYLLVTHGNGSSEGEALSVSAYEKIISTIKKSSSVLGDLSGHRLRHSWNYYYSKEVNSSQLSKYEKDSFRKYCMGWTESSNMPDIYNRKMISEEHKKIMLKIFNTTEKILKGE